ncbi:hypothetical protein [Bradyrhizobium lablabi]|uniref:hypothetical protein n=1 Tax=Bradyrhizobium lablabi TaxID=722472 RepID=UPI00090BAE74|nr:hypothetical protein [Bradyrhizobium lablabi]SHK61685.1 hypothetical protein SAMN05444321_0059 [Bradyrhizobium lablabi]
MKVLTAYVIEQLRASREELLAIANDELTYERITEWKTKYWELALVPASRLPGHVHFCNSFVFVIQAVPQQAPLPVVQDLRARVVGMLDENIRGIDSTQIVETIYEANIKKVKDTKLAALLNEFNAIKEAAPNAAAVLFRTILALVLQERAKIKAPTDSLATATGLSLEPSIKKSLGSGHPKIFDGAEERLLKRFLTGGQKDTFDNVAHKPGSNALVAKENLSDAVNLLNGLLPTLF